MKRLIVLLISASFLIFGCSQNSGDTAEKKDMEKSHNTEVAENNHDGEMMTEDFVMPDYKKFELTTTASGLQYHDVKVGDGKEATSGEVVSVHYTGWLTDGNMFDSSKKRGEHFVFPLGGGRVIKGWDEGVAGMKVGGTRILVIPPELGYGERGVGPIPPKSTLVFEVELAKINEPVDK
ncbi:FKBP-type peptidyl-prolyl cis-trans isomerase [bacterium]|nr:FKBP-type peptidyl-prolyl cis-trans isomerase [bacterium]